MWFADIQFGGHLELSSSQSRQCSKKVNSIVFNGLPAPANTVTSVAPGRKRKPRKLYRTRQFRQRDTSGTRPYSDGSIKATATYIREQFGSLDTLVNNGGINRSSDPNATLRETYRAVFETNVFGVVVVTGAFLLLRASKYPDRRTVNVTSGLERIGIAYSLTSKYSAKVWELPVYPSSKTALNLINAVDAVRLQKENIL